MYPQSRLVTMRAQTKGTPKVRRIKKAVVGAAAAASAALVLTACTAGAASSGGGGTSTGGATGSGNSGGTLTLGLLVPATTFEAPDMNWANESPYGQAVYDSLLQASPSGAIEPHLATAWSYNAAKTVLTLTLRTGVTFTDGTAFDASTAAQNLEAFQKGTSNNAADLVNMASATAASPTKLVITLKQPDPAFLVYLTQNAGLQESPKAFTSATAKTDPVGSGPYEMDTSATIPGSSYVFTANPGYWDKAEQHYAKIVMTVFSTSASLLDAIQGGQVNAANTFDNTALSQIQNAGFTVWPLQLNWTGLLLLDRDGSMSAPLGNVKVRQAINYAFDRPALLQALGEGFGSVTSSIFPTYSPGYEKSLDSYYTYDPAKAKQLLAQAGYPNGFTLNMPEAAALGASTYALIASQLTAVGIKVNYTSFTGNAIFTAILAPKFPATYFILQEDPTAWQESQFVIAQSATWNPFHDANTAVAGYVKTIQTGSATAADTATQELNQYLVQNAWFAPFFRQQSSFVSDKNTKVTVQTGNALPYLWNIEPS
jgi:peptide/nickel transport system substrate-binding protein